MFDPDIRKRLDAYMAWRFREDHATPADKELADLVSERIRKPKTGEVTTLAGPKGTFELKPEYYSRDFGLFFKPEGRKERSCENRCKAIR